MHDEGNVGLAVWAHSSLYFMLGIARVVSMPQTLTVEVKVDGHAETSLKRQGPLMKQKDTVLIVFLEHLVVVT